MCIFIIYLKYVIYFVLYYVAILFLLLLCTLYSCGHTFPATGMTARELEQLAAHLEGGTKRASREVWWSAIGIT